MRDKKMFISVILITTVMLFICGCGKQADPVSAEPKPTDTVKEVDTEEGKEEGLGLTHSSAVEPEESMESSEDEAIVDDGADADVKDDVDVEDEAGAEEVEITTKKTEDSKTESTKTESSKTESTKTGSTGTSNENSNRNSTGASNGTSKGNSNRNSTGTSNGNSNGNVSAQPTPTEIPKPAPTEPPQPAHSHSWKEHVATKQAWIPSIVVVDDYETQTTAYDYYICYCGFETADHDTISQHVKNEFLAGGSGGFTIQTHYKTEQVKVGSHEEDHGHYETSTYVDYYYCDCGATK